MAQRPIQRDLESALARQAGQLSTLRQDLKREKSKRRMYESAIFMAYHNIAADSPQLAETRLGTLFGRLTMGRVNELSKLHRRKLGSPRA